ncbi:MAG: protein-glutamate O-methyltransferase CheR [Desulfuromonadales bacterium]|nr:protein-glutamate O-methyltransferase CheR [Desulfuromonadales bacterium]
MSDVEFFLFRDIIHAFCGMHFSLDAKYLLEKRLAVRVRDLKLESFAEYFRYLTSSPAKESELWDIMDVLTVNETYFFREASQLKAFSDEILPELIDVKSRRGQRQLRIWCAGCSTGEEAYTIAMLLDRPELRGWPVEIIATDISRRALALAQRGVYGASSFRDLEPHYLERYFSNHGAGFRINEKLREKVSFRLHNLYDREHPGVTGKLDVVFCRNVIIYFDLDAKVTVVTGFHSALAEGGFLLLGHSESLINISRQFTLRHFMNHTVYQKPEGVGQGRSA